jgi:hypothetical protein
VPGLKDGDSTISKHPELPHNLHSLLGTIIRINPLGINSPNGKYGIPADNPFYSNPDPRVQKDGPMDSANRTDSRGGIRHGA